MTHPLVNILRGAMSILVSVVSHPYAGGGGEGGSLGGLPRTPEQQDIQGPVPAPSLGLFGFRALRPAIAIYPQFLEMLVSRLSSADHALCANSLQLINALMRDAVTNESELQWSKFVQKLQDLGVIRAVYLLMQSTALQDHAHPLIEFQSLTKFLLRKWRSVALDLGKPEHRRTLKGVYLTANPDKTNSTILDNGAGAVTPPPPPENRSSSQLRRKKPSSSEKWRRLGFKSESPEREFDDVGFLGMMDLADYAKSYKDEFQKLLLEQSTKPVAQRCPIARASLAVTTILYEHFEVDRSDIEDTKSYMILESSANLDELFKPLLLHWTRLHVAGLHSFFRLWKVTGATVEDFEKIAELVRILIESVVGGAPRTKDIQEVEEDMAEYEYSRLRGLQMKLFELTYEGVWGRHLRQMREELHHEALQFIKEQRIRCLLQGAWFPSESQLPSSLAPSSKPDGPGASSHHIYVQLSHNRRYLHFGQFDNDYMVGKKTPELDSLPDKSKSLPFFFFFFFPVLTESG